MCWSTGHILARGAPRFEHLQDPDDVTLSRLLGEKLFPFFSETWALLLCAFPDVSQLRHRGDVRPACNPAGMSTTTSSTHDLVSRLAALLRNERRAMADFVSELAEFDRRRCWEELGYPSLFEFLVRELGLSRGNAFYRTKAVSLVQRFPEVLEALRDGKLCITSIAEVARVLTAENRAEVLPRFFHVSRHEAKLVSAEIAPRPAAPLREVVTLAVEREPIARPASLAIPASGPVPEASAVHPLNSAASNVVELPREVRRPDPQREVNDPLTADLSRLHLTVTRDLLAKVEAARLALSHSRPGATIADVLELGAETALTREAKRRALVAKPRAGRPAHQPAGSGSDHIPAAVRREVWRRDGGCCQWKLASGGICGSKMRAQLDHIVPRGKGGQSTIENLRVLCERHNQYAARLEYGDDVMARYRRARARSA